MASVVDNEILAAEVWKIAVQRLRTRVSADCFDQWFANMIPVRLDKETLVLGVAEDFFGDWVMSYYDDEIRSALREVNGQSYSYKLEPGHIMPEHVVMPSRPAHRNQEAVKPADTLVDSEVPGGKKTAEPEDHLVTPAATGSSAMRTGNKIIPRYTFANFVVGEENRYAYIAAKRAAECPGVFNPLYIYGSTGIGKTHLLHAVAHEVLARNPHAVVRYAPCEEILNSFVESLQSHNYATFRAQLRNVDMLLVDDIHMLGKKGELQEQFFNAFNALYCENKQIILTSDKRPSEITGLEARLISRFEQGVTTEIYAPGLEVRIAILRGMQEEFMIRFDDEVLEFIASRISSNVRRLRGALMRLLTRVSIDPDLHLDLEMVEEILHPLFEEEHSARIVTVNDIQKKVAEYFNLGLPDLLSNKRPKSIAEPRMVAMYLARKLTSNSFPQIGSAFGRNHATIMNACTKIPELCAKDEELRRAVSMLERQLQS